MPTYFNIVSVTNVVVDLTNQLFYYPTNSFPGLQRQSPPPPAVRDVEDLELLAELLEDERELLVLQNGGRDGTVGDDGTVKKRDGTAVEKRAAFNMDFNGVQVSYPTYLRLTRLQVRKKSDKKCRFFKISKVFLLNN